MNAKGFGILNDSKGERDIRLGERAPEVLKGSTLLAVSTAIDLNFHGENQAR